MKKRSVLIFQILLFFELFADCSSWSYNENMILSSVVLCIPLEYKVVGGRRGGESYAYLSLIEITTSHEGHNCMTGTGRLGSYNGSDASNGFCGTLSGGGNTSALVVMMVMSGTLSGGGNTSALVVMMVMRMIMMLAW